MELSVKSNTRTYKIIFDLNLIDNIQKYINSSVYSGKIILIYSDSVIHIAEKLLTKLSINENIIFKLKIDDGEDNKSLENVNVILKKLYDLGCQKDSTIISLGGGSQGDIIGFISSIYMRGIKYINIPTTLLSMVDSSIGGKTAVNAHSIKNIFGTIYPPHQVLINPKFLGSLQSNEVKSGLGEIIKYGFINDENLIKHVIDNYNCIMQLENYDLILDIILKCCSIKKYFIEKDEFDSNERHILNFGHTLGHIIEKKYKHESITHGEAIISGMYYSIKLSKYKNILKSESYNKMIKYFDKLNFKNKFIFDDNDISNIKYDKKSGSKNYKFILLKDFGKPIISNNVTENDILNII